MKKEVPDFEKDVSAKNRTFYFISICYVILIGSVFLLLNSFKIFDPSDKFKKGDFIAASIAAGSALAAIIALILSNRGLKFTQNAHEGQLYIKMMERYTSDEMRKSLRLLGKFKEENKRNLHSAIASWNLQKEAGNEDALKLEDARHTVKYFYRDIMQLYQAGYLSKKLTLRILNTGGRVLFRDVILGMDEFSNIKYQFDGEFAPFKEFDEELNNIQTRSLTDKKKPRVVCLIPARYDATRFPGKLMSLLIDKTVIRYTYENVDSMKLFDYVAVVTNSEIIKNEIEIHGGNVIYIPKNYESGSDRIAAALAVVEADIIVNVQGDEPFVKMEPLKDMISSINLDVNDNMVVSLMRPMDNIDHIKSSDFVKTVCDKNNFALFFSRSVLPFEKRQGAKAIFYEHIGVYVYTKKALLAFSNLEPTNLETIESIECLRLLENGIPIKMIETPFKILEIDTEEDRLHAEELIRAGHY